MAIFNLESFYALMKEDALKLPYGWDGVHLGQYLQDNSFHTYQLYLERIVGADGADKYRDVCICIEKIIDEYYNGFPCRAYKQFEMLMEMLWESPIRVYNKTYWGESFETDDPLKLYRMRKTKENKEFERSDIFHTPFNQRAKVSSCRYSIAGYPSLYLSTSLQLSNLELSGKYNIPQDAIASRFQLIRDMSINGEARIKVIELAIKPQDFERENFQQSKGNEMGLKITKFDEVDLENELVMKNYLLWYPLLATCSAICTSKENAFSSEYIVPQLLSQWLRDKFKDDIIHGIRYFSCRSVEASKRGINYMFPTKYIDNRTEYCSVLGNAFELTQPVKMKDFDTVEECERSLINNIVLKMIHN